MAIKRVPSWETARENEEFLLADFREWFGGVDLDRVSVHEIGRAMGVSHRVLTSSMEVRSWQRRSVVCRIWYQLSGEIRLMGDDELAEWVSAVDSGEGKTARERMEALEASGAVVEGAASASDADSSLGDGGEPIVGDAVSSAGAGDSAGGDANADGIAPSAGDAASPDGGVSGASRGTGDAGAAMGDKAGGGAVANEAAAEGIAAGFAGADGGVGADSSGGSPAMDGMYDAFAGAGDIGSAGKIAADGDMVGAGDIGDAPASDASGYAADAVAVAGIGADASGADVGSPRDSSILAKNPATVVHSRLASSSCHMHTNPPSVEWFVLSLSTSRAGD